MVAHLRFFIAIAETTCSRAALWPGSGVILAMKWADHSDTFFGESPLHDIGGARRKQMTVLSAVLI